MSRTTVIPPPGPLQRLVRPGLASLRLPTPLFFFARRPTEAASADERRLRPISRRRMSPPVCLWIGRAQLRDPDGSPVRAEVKVCSAVFVRDEAQVPAVRPPG